MRILRAVASEAHECGCLVGIYETYGGEIVRLVDEVGEDCSTHSQGQQLAFTDSPLSDAPDTLAPDRSPACR